MATFAIIRGNFFARGFQYLNDLGDGLVFTKALVNEAYLNICDEQHWSFLLATAAGAAPLTIADLGSIESVVDTLTERKLHPLPEDELRDAYPVVTQTGAPEYYFLDDTIVRTFPVGGTLSVRYRKVPAELVADGDTPLLPARFHPLIVHYMVREAGAEDAPEAAMAAAQKFEVGLTKMLEWEMGRAGARHYQRQTAHHEDA